MNRPPEILVNSGFVTDENGVLTEMIIPNNVVTQNMPSIVTTYATTINWIPSNAATLVEFNAPNVETIQSLTTYTNLTKVNLPAVTSVYGANSTGTFKDLANVTEFTLTNLNYIRSTATSSSSYVDGGAFYGCSSVVNFNFPSLKIIESQKIGAVYICPFFVCTALKIFNAPKLQQITGNFDAFYGCTSLESVTLGSDGHPVTSLQSLTFNGLTQSGLTITIYTQGGAALSGEPWGATNAEIIYEEA